MAVSLITKFKTNNEEIILKCKFHLKFHIISRRFETLWFHLQTSRSNLNFQFK